MRLQSAVQRSPLRGRGNGLAVALVLGTVASPRAEAQTLAVPHSSTDSRVAVDGKSPSGSLVMDTAGNLYGTTEEGGALDDGTVFKLDRSGHETVLHSFKGSGHDGRFPLAGLLMDAAGNLYGTAEMGGSFGDGTVFKLDRLGHETVLYSFPYPDGGSPEGAGVVMDSAGNLYGTTAGTVFKLDRHGHETLLHSFTASGGDGACPEAELIMDSASNLYGTTQYGGTLTNGHLTIGMAGPCLGEDGYGTVFKLDTSGHETVLYTFSASSDDGAFPKGGLVMDSAGNLYGTTGSGGASGYGTVFKLDTLGHETVLHSFPDSGGDGKHPQAVR